MKIQSSFLFLALMSTIEPCQSDDNGPFEKFKNQHIVDETNINDMNDMNQGCDHIIKIRNILYPDRKCKDKNTFIIGLIKDVISVCKGKKDTNGVITSVSDFATVLCERIDKKNVNPPCKYTSQKKKQKIRIACVNGLPVHLEGPEKLSNNQGK
ncbi:hypothetical protein CRENBAI_017714 [Crenichthys baileyi]|uniref:Ribonuclease A-domain domain-containing protein n=1 Tax=Crenichthys baileyi TaxID=28760 RepID=A0AAV9R7G3_9TELE